MSASCRLCGPKSIPAWRRVLAWKLHCWADRIDPHNATRVTSFSFTIEKEKGVVLHHDRRGCGIAYLGHDEYEKAHR